MHFFVPILKSPENSNSLQKPHPTRSLFVKQLSFAIGSWLRLGENVD